MDADAIVVGAGLAGLVAAGELLDAGRRVILVDQEPAQNLGAQAYWSFGGLFFVDSPEQRRMRIKDSVELAWQDWLGSAGFDRLDGPDASECGRVAGRRPTSTSPPVRSGPGCTTAACAGSRSWAGPSAGATPPTGTATPSHASTSPGAPGRVWSLRSRRARSRAPSAGSCGSRSGTGWTS